MKTMWLVVAVALGLALMPVTERSEAYSDYINSDPGLTVVVFSADGSQRLSGIEVKIQDNYLPFSQYPECIKHTDENGEAYFSKEDLSGFTVRGTDKDGGEFSEIYQSDKDVYPDAHSYDQARFNMLVVATTTGQTPVKSEIMMPANEEMTYYIHMQ